MAHPARAHPGFFWMKQGVPAEGKVTLGILSGLPDNSLVPISTLGEERHCKSRVFFLRTQDNHPAPSRTQTSRPRVQRTRFLSGAIINSRHTHKLLNKIAHN